MIKLRLSYARKTMKLLRKRNLNENYNRRNEIYKKSDATNATQDKLRSYYARDLNICHIQEKSKSICNVRKLVAKKTDN